MLALYFHQAIDMFLLPKSYTKSVLFVLSIVLIFSASNYAVNLKTDSSGQIRKSNKVKNQSKTKMNKPITGEWSGQHITLKITAQGADVEYDCAHGSITQKIIADKKNRFTVAGTYVEEHGGPVRADAPTEGVAVRYIGQVSGKKMTLTVKRKDNGAIVGTFTLLHGQESLLVKCR